MFAAWGAALWAFGYGILAVWWTAGGGGFPFGDNDPDPAIAMGMSILGGVRQESAAPVIAVVAFAASGVAAFLAVRTRRLERAPAGRTATGSRLVGGRRIVEGMAWVVAAFLGVVLPDYRPLVAIGHIPVLIVGKPFGWPEGVTIASQVPWPVVNQFVCMAGAVLFAVAAARHRALRTASVPAQDAGSVSTEHAGGRSTGRARLGVVATWVAVAVPVVYAATRWSWALGIPVGFSTEQLRSMNEELPGIWWGGAALGSMGLVGSALTIGLIRPWGETFPRWIPCVGGRRVPIAVAVVPACAVAMGVTSAGLMFVRLLIADPNRLNWGIHGSAVLWPVWGVALATAALAYRSRRMSVTTPTHREEPTARPRRSPVVDAR